MAPEPFLKQLNDLKGLIDDKMGQFLLSAEETFPKKEPSIKEQLELIKHACLSGGKRLRPIISIMAYKTVGGKNTPMITSASISLELFHNYTLIHDDIYDEDDTRRGVTTNHSLLINSYFQKYGRKKESSLLYNNLATRFGVVAGIINGKILHSLSLRPILNLKSITPKQKMFLVNIFIRQSIDDNIGQSIDLALEKNTEIGLKEYLTMARYKTGCLLKTSAEWGAYLGGGSARQLKALSSYAEELGYVFQIKDDLLDIGIGGKKGRQIGSDIKKGKRTLPIIHALKNSDNKERETILKFLGNGRASKKNINSVIEIIKRSKSHQYCEVIAKKRLALAIRFLKKASPLTKTGEKFFQELAYFMWERTK